MHDPMLGIFMIPSVTIIIYAIGHLNTCECVQASACSLIPSAPHYTKYIGGWMGWAVEEGVFVLQLSIA